MSENKTETSNFNTIKKKRTYVTSKVLPIRFSN